MKLNRIAPVAAALACMMMLSACANTIRGAGSDAANVVDATQNAGHKVARATR